ncbi:MAG: ATP synthase F1 subunit gamma [Chloroflexi bacterium]|nr:MAG: ATP synthase F1 subunit gamma [Chloroflexota bacterium]
MPSAREVRMRIRSVKNISQVTRALQSVSQSKVRKAMQTVARTRPYATKAWQVLTHVAGQPGRESLHPLLTHHAKVENILVIMVSGDRGLAGAYNSNILRFTLDRFNKHEPNVRYIVVGRKGRDLLLRRRKKVMAEFSGLPADPSFNDVSAIGRLAVDEFLSRKADQVYLSFTDFVNLAVQRPALKLLLPLEFESGSERVVDFERTHHVSATYIYEPGQNEILDEVIPRFTQLQVYHAILESIASEHAARMVAMKNATDNAQDLANALTLEYNKARQQSITSEMLDIVGGAEALEHS